MAYILDDEAKDLLSDVKDFCLKEVREQVLEADRTGEWPAELYKKAQELQLSILDVPEEFGGLGLPKMTQAAIFEQLAWTDAGFAVTLNGNGLALKPVLIAGNESQKKKCSEIILNGGWGAFALTEPSAGCDAGAGKTTAQRVGDEYVLNGSKCFITNAQIADFFVITALTDKEKGSKGMSAFLVYKDTPGLSVGRHEDKMGIRASVTSDVILEDVHIPAENLLGKEGMGFVYAMETLDLARIWCAVMGVGVAQRCIDEAVSYGRERIQFGKSILKNQAMQFKIADMEMRCESARQLCALAIRLSDLGLPCSKEAAEAKCMAGDAAMANAVEAVQVLGGYGYSREFPVEKLMRDAKIFQIFEGTNEIQRMVIGRAVIGKV